jgi:hypothetical protein
MTTCVTWLVTGVALGVAAPAPAQNPQALRRDVLAAEVALAESKEIYLVLDLGAGEVTLEVQNVVLRRFPATVEAGRPRSLHADVLQWPTLVYTLESGMIELERAIIRPPSKADSTAAAAADTAKPKPMGREQLLGQRERMLASIPANYNLHFAPDLDIIVQSESRTGGWQGFLTGAREHWSRLMSRVHKEPLPMTVRLQMDVADAKRFGVALRQGMSMLVKPALPATTPAES